ncbi:hypothetical protein NEOLEDRAFT_1127587 [Neolentinus lepideus HHB14362 ss-1]|uniref:ferric-chelate reductase (NADPH) n=1 Tax=Neolentinus lepideus HHB14362 ss-1 TaxID=1314782 RepID=A0A165VJN7_9AGAM|nr:hypothetical protein NEOLEDRAFT_1127587 [Neolentinus lepideus HHB14362 ss-1]
MNSPAEPPAMPKGLTDKAISIALAVLYTKEIWYTIGGFIGLIMICHWGSVVLSKCIQWSKTPIDDVERRSLAARRGRTSLRRLPLALVNLWRVMAFRCTLRIGKSYSLCLSDVFCTMAYMAVIFTFALLNTTDLEGKIFDVKFYSNRAGGLAAVQFPLITALGTKNNVISLLTGVSYEKLNNLHRMAARVLFVLLWIHAGPKFAAGITSAEASEQWLQFGFLAGFGFAALIVISLRPVRAAAYEFFFYTHFALAFLILLGGYFHLAEFKLQKYIWPSFLVWGLDRFIRLARVLYFKLTPYIVARPEITSAGIETKAYAEPLTPDLVRLCVPRPPGFSWSPGQVAYVIVPSISRLPIEAHPFTIASLCDSEMEKQSPLSEKGREHWSDLVFLINAQAGFTKRLANHASKGRQDPLTVLIDGPYGHSPDLSGSDELVVVAGGTGISYALPMLLAAAKKGTCRRVLFIWSIRDPSHLRWVAPALMKAISMAPARMSMSISVYITSSTKLDLPKLLDTFDSDAQSLRSSFNRSEESVFTEKKLGGGPSVSGLLDLHAVQISYGRPNFDSILYDEMLNADGHMTVGVCGSQAIARAVRSALKVNPFAGANGVLKGGPSVTLHVESFGYA